MQEATKHQTKHIFWKNHIAENSLTMTSLNFPFKPFAKLPHWQAQSRKHARQDRVTPAFYLNNCWIDWRSHLLWSGPQVVSYAFDSVVDMGRMTFTAHSHTSEMDPHMLSKLSHTPPYKLMRQQGAPTVSSGIVSHSLFTLQIVSRPAGLNNEFEVPAMFHVRSTNYCAEQARP